MFKLDIISNWQIALTNRQRRFEGQSGGGAKITNCGKRSEVRLYVSFVSTNLMPMTDPWEAICWKFQLVLWPMFFGFWGLQRERRGLLVHVKLSVLVSASTGVSWDLRLSHLARHFWGLLGCMNQKPSNQTVTLLVHRRFANPKPTAIFSAKIWANIFQLLIPQMRWQLRGARNARKRTQLIERKWQQPRRRRSSQMPKYLGG